MATGADTGRWIRENPTRVLAVAVSVVVVGLSAWVGLKARSAAVALAAKRASWEQTSNQLATVRQQFRVPTSTEAAKLVAESSQMGALGVSESDRLALVESVGRLAEACALTGVRVNILAAPDSAYVAERSIAGQVIQPARYALAVEFGGSFANAVKFVSSLPLSVSVARMSASQRSGVRTYLLILSVYELDANPGN